MKPFDRKGVVSVKFTQEKLETRMDYQHYSQKYDYSAKAVAEALFH